MNEKWKSLRFSLLLAGSKRDVKGETEYLDSRGVMMRGTGSRMKSNNYPANWFVTPVRRTGTWPRLAWLEGTLQLRSLGSRAYPPSISLKVLEPITGVFMPHSGATFKATGIVVNYFQCRDFKVRSHVSISFSRSLSVSFSLPPSSLREHGFLNGRSEAVSKILSYFA